MKISRVKNYIIVLLCISALYLTVYLWFEKISDRSFFYSFLQAISYSPPIEVFEPDQSINPKRVILSTDTGEIKVLMNGFNDSEVKKDADNIIMTAVKQGDYQGNGKLGVDLNFSDVLKEQIMIYDYGFSMPSEIFAGSITKRANSFQGNIETFDKIVLVPSKGGVTTSAQVYFIDSDSSLYAKYLTKSTDADLRVNRFIKTHEPNQLFYTSSELEETKGFKKNVFIPEITEDGLLYTAVTVENQYAPRGDVLLNPIEQRIDWLFDAPNAKHSVRQEDSYTYSDQNTVVKYYDNNTLEYSSYKIEQKTLGSTLFNDYLVATSFLKLDELITNEYYFSDFSVENDKKIFSFDYAVNNFPILLSKEYRNTIGMDHAIEITVRNRRVIRFKKIVYNFTADTTHMDVANISIDKAIIAMTGSSTSNISLNDAILGYKMDNAEKLTLNWFLTVDGVEWVNSAKVE